MRKLKISNKLKIVLLIFLVIAAIALFPVLSRNYTDFERLLKNSGNFGPIVYILLMILAILLSPIPAAPLAIVSGIVFGPMHGFIYTLIGATMGAVLAFSISRFFLRDYFKKHFENTNFYRRIKVKKNHNIAFIVLITRLMPQVSFDAISYLAGMTSLNTGVFALVTFFGMIPIVLILTFFGTFLEPYKTILGFLLLTAFILYIFHQAFKCRNKLMKK